MIRRHPRPRPGPCANTPYEVSPESLYVINVLRLIWPKWMMWRFTKHACPEVRAIAEKALAGA